MLRSLFALAVQGTMRKRRSSLLTFLVLLLSFSCAIMSLSITQSISSTNTEYRLNTFGEWYLAIPDGMEEDGAWLEHQSWVRKAGSCRVYGWVSRSMSAYGSVDEAYFDLSRARMLAGRLPRENDEVALTEKLLEDFDITEYEIGQEITLSFSSYYRNTDEVAISGGQTFKLCGVFRESVQYWHFGYNKKENRPVTVILTDEAARDVYETLDAAAQRENGRHLQQPSQQFYVFVERNARKEAIDATKKHMQSTRDIVTQDVQPCVNLAAYPNEEAAVSSNTLYSFLIAAVALAAVLCVSVLQLPTEVHSFAVLRSIGITKWQLLLLMLLEALLLIVPAVALSIPLGAGLTWFALRLLMYSGSVPVQVIVPYEQIKLLLVLWLAVLLLARLLLFAVTVRTPLSGKMQLTRRKARRVGCSRGMLIALLLTAFCTVLLYVVPEAADTFRWLDYERSKPSYSVYNYGVGHFNTTVPEDFCEELEKVPGVAWVEGSLDVFSEKTLPEDVLVSLSFEGFEERTVNFSMVDYDTWEDTLRLSDEDAQRFVRGDIVLLGFAEEGDIDVLPEGDIMIRALDPNGNCVGEVSATPLVWVEPKGFLFTRAKLYHGDAYSIFCSKAYLDKLTSTFGADTKWNGYAAGDTSGYSFVHIMADSNADDLSTDCAIEELCRQQRELRFYSGRESRDQRIQGYTQKLILLLVCGGCVALVSLLLLASAFALEAEQERRSYSILRVIGMSLRQMRRRVFGKALWRSIFAVLAGWALYAALSVSTQLALNELTFAEAAQNAWSGFTYYGGGLSFITVLSAVMLAVLLGVSLIAKRALKRTTLLK